MNSSDLTRLIAELRTDFTGEIRCDKLARALYATDAGIHEIPPDLVLFPKCADDVRAAVKICKRFNLPLTPRGAGTGLTGGALNRGAVIDFSRFMNRVLEIDPARRIARVEPGVVLDQLNEKLKPHGLHFSPDVATANRATIGGMIGNNSAGAHSLVIGRTCDHVLGVEVVLGDGSTHTWGAGADSDDRRGAATARAENPFARRCDEVVAAVVRECADEILSRYPKTFRRNGGYALDRLKIENGRPNTEQLIVGSEGTLCAVVGATLNLLPLPKNKGLIVVHFHDLMQALRAVPAVLALKPAAVELVDKLILDGTRDNPAMLRRRWFLDGDPAAILIVEFYEESADLLARRLDAAARHLQMASVGYAWPMLLDARLMADVWDVRKAGTGLLMSRPGDVQPHDFIDDCAVDPARLHDYIYRLKMILSEEGVERTGFYGHPSVGLLHVRPALNLKSADDVRKLRRIAERTCDLVKEFGGAMTGEHGEGLVRSEFIERLFGTRLYEAFRRIKTAFDPTGLFNPGKIVDPLPMDENLRYGPAYRSEKPVTMLDFSTHGGMAGLAEMCSGIGECRKRLVGTLCPSYQATGDETHSTRARANALREALSNRDLLDGLADAELEKVFDLCISCKACKTECPTGTDVAKLKTEWLYHKNKRAGVSRQARLIGNTIRLAAWGSRLAPLSNWIAQSKIARAFMEHWFGLERRVPPPPYARTTFRQWFAKRRRAKAAKANDKPAVVYFVDTWVNYHLPQVGRAAVKVLEALGYDVLVPPTVCCGRPLISKGLLDEAAALARENVVILGPYAEKGISIVGTEPSCASVLQDELPQFVRTPTARKIAEAAQTIEVFVSRALRENPAALKFKSGAPRVLYHGHCHQKALTGTVDGLHLLNACTGGSAEEIDSGCCGMAGSFGHEAEHYEIARAIGEQRLFPAVRRRCGAEIAVSGFSCRHQIGHHTDARPRHVIEYVAEALEEPD